MSENNVANFAQFSLTIKVNSESEANFVQVQSHCVHLGLFLLYTVDKVSLENCLCWLELFMLASRYYFNSEIVACKTISHPRANTHYLMTCACYLGKQRLCKTKSEQISRYVDQSQPNWMPSRRYQHLIYMSFNLSSVRSLL